MSRINLQKSIESLIPKPLVIIDRQVDQLSSLVKDIQSRGNIVILDTELDGIAQITQALSQYQKFCYVSLSFQIVEKRLYAVQLILTGCSIKKICTASYDKSF